MAKKFFIITTKDQEKGSTAHIYFSKEKKKTASFEEGLSLATA